MRRNAKAEVRPEDLKPDTLRESYEVGRAMARGVRQAQEENRKLGLPNVVTHDGRLVEEFPDGTVRTVDVQPTGKTEAKSRAK
jgi:hypothetical protein